MKEIEIVAYAFHQFANLSVDDFKLPLLYWKQKESTEGLPIVLKFPTPATGDVVRIDPAGVRTTIVSGLNFPTAMVMGLNNKLYISNWGFEPPLVGNGQILQVSISCPKQTSGKSY